MNTGDWVPDGQTSRNVWSGGRTMRVPGTPVGGDAIIATSAMPAMTG
ncbi:hypothetical protein BKP42_43010 [Rhodococcus erythropolis]|nr:hypothetical protein BKP42_43010 [Rhodococcus erythropolis]